MEIISAYFRFALHYAYKLITTVAVIMLAVYVSILLCSKIVYIPNPNAFWGTAETIERMIQCLPRVGSLLGDALSIVSTEVNKVSSETGLLEEMAFAVLYTLTYKIFKLMYKGIIKLGDVIIPVSEIVSKIINVPCLWLTAAGSIMAANVFGVVAEALFMKIGAIPGFAMLLTAVLIVSILSSIFGKNSNWIDSAGRMLLDFVALAFIYLMLLCISCLEYQYMSAAEEAATVICLVISVLAVTILESLNFAKIFQKN